MPVFVLLSLSFFAFLPKKTDYILTEGIIYQKDYVSDTCLYDGGILELYYYIEQNFSVYPQGRQYCSGIQKVLFEMEYDSTGNMVFFHPLERYYWYNIDNRVRPMVTDLVEVIGGAPGWTVKYEGKCYLPIAFTVQRTGRVTLDYISLSKKAKKYVHLGDK